jgi:hypothetical protein
VLLEDGGDVCGERGRTGVSRPRVLGEGAVEDGRQARGEPAEGGQVWRRRGLVDDLVENLRRPLAAEGTLPHQQLVEDHANREHVAASVEGLAAHLLRAHVVDGPDHHAGLREPRVAAEELGDPEVHDLGGAVIEQPDVAGLDVAMDDPALVRVGEPAADLDHDVELLRERERLVRAKERLEVDAREHLHGDEGDAPVLAELVNDDDVRVLETACRLGLLEEAPAAVVVGGALDGEGLDRHLALQGLVSAAVDHPHAAAADAAGDQVLPDPPARSRLGGLGQHGVTPRTSGAPR